MCCQFVSMAFFTSKLLIGKSPNCSIFKSRKSAANEEKGWEAKFWTLKLGHVFLLLVTCLAASQDKAPVETAYCWESVKFLIYIKFRLLSKLNTNITHWWKCLPSIKNKASIKTRKITLFFIFFFFSLNQGKKMQYWVPFENGFIYD